MRSNTVFKVVTLLAVATCAHAGVAQQATGGGPPQARPAPPPPLFDELLPNAPGQRLRVDRMVLGDTSIPPHRRTGSAYLYVLEGAARLQLEGQPETVVTAGRGFFEPAGARVMVIKSAEPGKPAVVLAVSVSRDGEPMVSFN